MKIRSCITAFIIALVAATASAVTLTLIPALPAAGSPFQMRIEGTWPDTCVPREPKLAIDDNVLEVTFRNFEGGCFSAGSAWAETLSVPGLPSGIYTLRARTTRYGQSTSLIDTTFSIGEAAPELGWERVLLPIVLTAGAPGAFGSRWSTAISILNGSTETIPLDMFPCPLPDPPGPLCPPMYSSVPPNTEITSMRDAPRGRFWYVPVSAIADVSVSLHAMNEAAPGQPRFEVPVVREREFRSGRTVFPRIEHDDDSRILLRLYGDGLRPQQVRVFVQNLANGWIDRADLVELTTQGTYASFPRDPGFAQIPLAPRELGGDMRIWIESVEEGREYWAFVTVTDNATSFVTTYTPALGD